MLGIDIGNEIATHGRLASAIDASSKSITQDASNYPDLFSRPRLVPIPTSPDSDKEHVDLFSLSLAYGMDPDGKLARIKVNKFGYVLCVGP